MVLQAAREASGKTQKQVAGESNVTERMYQDYEYGKRKPGVGTAIRISRSLGIKALDDFYTLWETQSEPDGNQT